MTEPKKTRRTYESNLPLGSLRISPAAQDEDRERHLLQTHEYPAGETQREEVVNRLIDRIKKI
jgi:hypothetical protein